ncbi:expressed protein [Dictyostelium purpureum]|uniref:Expressed protein n=1 Tax=Dictyostelium purpureum TaxID=5786 RepID=F0ZHC8_DICPU|nr:uncharacterized protein DICPUDRAFT_91802 [Dictyostelium purpureum]EGC36648.1 expressed protein [Dictyostelium purpureum]|eukprot:XP_003286816.1 expressed protein [Dictyostelium purpureum]
MGQKQSNSKQFDYEFGFEIIENPKSFSERMFPVEYNYNKEFPIELIGVLTEDEYEEIGDYIRYISGKSPHLHYLQNLLVFVFCFFLPLVMFVNNVCLKFVSVYLLASAFLNAFITLPIAIYMLVKIFKLRKGVNKILKEKNVQLKKQIKFNKFAFLFIIILYLHAALQIYWFFDYYNHGGYFVNTMVHYAIGLDVFIIFFFIYNYALFSRSRGILTSKYQVGNDDEYLQVLNDNIRKYMGPVPYSLLYNPPISTSSPSSVPLFYVDNNNINDIDVEQSQKLLLNPYI